MRDIAVISYPKRVPHFTEIYKQVLRGQIGCGTGNGGKLSSSQAEPGQASKSAVA